MHKQTIALILLIFTPLALGKGSAGIIPYACHEGDAYILLADHIKKNKRGYGTFGGGAKPGETIPQTAVREFHEETGCVFDEPTSKQLDKLTPSRSGKFSFYVWQVPYKDTDLMKHSKCGTSDERENWVWVPLESLTSAVDNHQTRLEIPGTNKTIKLWKKSNQSLREALDNGLLKNDETRCRH